MSSHISAPALESDSIDTSIRDMMLQKLSQELLDLIEHYFYELAFLPGYIYPLGKPHLLDDPTGTEALAWDRRAKAITSLLCLSKDIYCRYSERVYTDNIIVWGSGQKARWIMAYTLDGQPSQRRTSIEVVFGLRDRECTVVKRLREMNSEPPREASNGLSEAERQNPYNINELQLAWMRRFSDCAVINELLLAWTLKCHECALQSKPLDEITLDFRQCYDPDGKWLGDELVRQLDLTDLREPSRVTIRAPDLEKEEEISKFLRTADWDVVP
ncbi:MAG: hypothetical protein L6R42_008909 [Xanthoria sp. 1 TBL-2021]|nr:MAG: hypothetical protein L6R42_008909 [Xanthoria sp. 1 TBL-2021]